MVIESNASATAITRANSGISAPAQPHRVAEAVQPLVVVHDAGVRLVQELDLADDLEALHRVPLDGLELGLGESAGLLQHPGRHTELADVVQHPGVPERAHPVLAHADRAGDEHRGGGHPLAVAAGVDVLRLDRGHQRRGRSCRRRAAPRRTGRTPTARRTAEAAGARPQRVRPRRRPTGRRGSTPNRPYARYAITERAIVPWNTTTGETRWCSPTITATSTPLTAQCVMSAARIGPRTWGKSPACEPELTRVQQVVDAAGREGGQRHLGAVEQSLDDRRALGVVRQDRAPRGDRSAPHADQRDRGQGRHRPQRDRGHVPAAAGQQRLADDVQQEQDRDDVHPALRAVDDREDEQDRGAEHHEHDIQSRRQ